MEVAAVLEEQAVELEGERGGGTPSLREPRLSDVLGGSVTKQMMGADGVQRQHVERVMRKAQRRCRIRDRQ
jgi:hypothetical protein